MTSKSIKLEGFLIDLKNFKKENDWTKLSQLLMGVNDLQSVAYLNTLITTDKYLRKELKDFQDGVILFLLRMNVSIIQELIAHPFSYITRQEKAGKGVLWDLIAKDKKCMKAYEEVKRLLKTGGLGKLIKDVRNNLGFHYNHKGNSTEMSDGITKLIHNRSVRRAQPLGRFIKEDDSSTAVLNYLRFIFIEDIQVCMWQQFGLFTKRQHETYRDRMIRLRKELAGLSYRLLLLYLEKYDPVDAKEGARRLKQGIRNRRR